MERGDHPKTPEPGTGSERDSRVNSPVSMHQLSSVVAVETIKPRCSACTEGVELTLDLQKLERDGELIIECPTPYVEETGDPCTSQFRVTAYIERKLIIDSPRDDIDGRGLELALEDRETTRDFKMSCAKCDRTQSLHVDLEGNFPCTLDCNVCDGTFEIRVEKKYQLTAEAEYTERSANKPTEFLKASRLPSFPSFRNIGTKGRVWMVLAATIISGSVTAIVMSDSGEQEDTTGAPTEPATPTPSPTPKASTAAERKKAPKQAKRKKKRRKKVARRTAKKAPAPTAAPKPAPKPQPAGSFALPKEATNAINVGTTSIRDNVPNGTRKGKLTFSMSPAYRMHVLSNDPSMKGFTFKVVDVKGFHNGRFISVDVTKYGTVVHRFAAELHGFEPEDNDEWLQWGSTEVQF